MLDRALRGATVALVLGLGAVGLALPDSVLVGGCAWLAFLFAALAGWGTLAIRATRGEDVDFGMRVAFGIAAFLAVAGPLLAIGILTRPVLLGLAALGVAGFAWHELTTTEACAWKAARRAARYVRAQPALGALIILLVAFALFEIVAGLATLDRNPWDDDLIYTPLAKRLLDAGDLVEPFSFRRLGAYGGQTILQALGDARGSLANVHLIDRGLGLGTTLLLIVGHARARKTHGLWLGLLVLVLLLAPHAYLNSASYWTGALVFVALYRSLVAERWVMVGLVGAAACTLRQNYLPVAVVFVALALVFRARKQGWTTTKRTWRDVALAGGLAILPYAIAALRASHTFLFPVLKGTFNTSIPLAPISRTWTDELTSLAWSAIETSPIVVVPLLAIVLLVATDRRAGRPLHAMMIAAAAGVVLLVHGFADAGPFNTWRYAFGFCAALAAMMTVELSGLEDTTDVASDLALPQIGRWLLLAALCAQLVATRDHVAGDFTELADSLREGAAIEGAGDANAAVERARYARLQAALPAGARLAVLVDDPAYLDFARNPIANLDMPGFAGPGSGWPGFQGAEALRGYLAGLGFDDVVFVRPDRSRTAYRRDHWVARVFTDIEFYTTMGAYTLDTLDALDTLTKQIHPIYDADGLVAVPLAGAAVAPVAAGDEAARRDAWLRALADRANLHQAWTLASRAGVQFLDGWDVPVFVDATGAVVHGGPGKATRRAMKRRSHARVRGDAVHPMHLVARGAVAIDHTTARPRIDASIDGGLVGSVVVDAAGAFALDVDVPPSSAGWHDLYFVFSALAPPDKEIHELFVAHLDTLEWEPR